MSGVDTIYALSSGAGRAGIAVVRVSGRLAGQAVMKLCGALPPGRTHCLRKLRVPDTDELIDEAVVVWCPGPNTVTGEDVAEFHLHGSRAIVALFLEVLGGIAGLRSAEPGEFTRRGFVNGRMGLAEVEGLADVLEARTRRQLRQAMEQYQGVARQAVEVWRAQLVRLLGTIEAVLDFSDEDDIGQDVLCGFWSERLALVADIEKALAQGRSARLLRDGAKVILVGRPNTGKSSLLNRLAKRDAAIVSSIAGTTRDVLEVQMDLQGIPVVLTDTAGLREEASDEIEAEGMSRTRNEVIGGDLIVWVCSGDQPGSEVWDGDRKPDFILWNKSDLVLANVEQGEGVFCVSAISGQGLDEFISSLIASLKCQVEGSEQAVIVRDRHWQAAEEAIRKLNDAGQRTPHELELVAADLRGAADALGRITGRIGVEEWLGSIFDRFCIGK